MLVGEPDPDLARHLTRAHGATVVTAADAGALATALDEHNDVTAVVCVEPAPEVAQAAHERTLGERACPRSSCCPPGTARAAGAFADALARHRAVLDLPAVS